MERIFYMIWIILALQLLKISRSIAELECGKSQSRSEENRQESRLINSEDVNLKDVPWLVGVIYYLPDATWKGCTGSLISNRVVLTAAICVAINLTDFANPNELGVVRKFEPGTEPPKIMDTKEVVALKHLETNMFVNIAHGNLALLLLARPWDSGGEDFWPICLFPNEPGPWLKATIYGFGSTATEKEDNFRSTNYAMGPAHKITNLTYVEKSTCNMFYFFGPKQTECMKLVEKCLTLGDRGGPLVFQDDNGVDQQILMAATTTKCDKDGMPDFLAINYYLSFIEETVEEFKNMSVWIPPPPRSTSRPSTSSSTTCYSSTAYLIIQAQLCFLFVNVLKSLFNDRLNF